MKPDWGPELKAQAALTGLEVDRAHAEKGRPDVASHPSCADSWAALVDNPHGPFGRLGPRSCLPLRPSAACLGLAWSAEARSPGEFRGKEGAAHSRPR